MESNKEMYAVIDRKEQARTRAPDKKGIPSPTARSTLLPDPKAETFAARMSKFARRLYCFARRIYRLEEEATRLADDFVLLAEMRSKVGWPRPPNDLSRKLLEKLAMEGVTQVSITRLANGCALVVVGESKSIKLSPILADLLQVLCKDSGQSPDGLVGFKTLHEVAAFLEVRHGKKVGPHALVNNLSRLRRVLRDHDVNPFLVQMSRAREWRFALRKDGKPMIDGDLQ